MDNKDYILHVSVDAEKVKKQAETTDLEEAIRSEAGWMEQSGIYLKDIEEAGKTQPAPIYVYEEYDDADPYGDRIVELYADKDIALARLKKSVEAKFAMPFDEVPGSVKFDEQDTFQEDYVSYYNGNSVCYWSVTEQPILSQLQR